MTKPYKLEDCDKIAELAAAFMTPREIAIVMEIPLDELLNEISDRESLISKCFNTGFLKSKFEVNKKIVDLAKAGSSPAQTMAVKLIQDVELSQNGG